MCATLYNSILQGCEVRESRQEFWQPVPGKSANQRIPSGACRAGPCMMETPGAMLGLGAGG